METAEARERALEVFAEWQARNSTQGATAGALIILERLQKNYSLSIIDHRSKNGQQLEGATGAALAAILRRFGETRRFLSESGRTSRGLLVRLEDLLNRMVDLELDELSVEDRNSILIDLQWRCVRKVQEYFNRQHLKPIFDAGQTSWQFIANLLALAQKAGNAGPVAQHLVGAKLELRFPDEVIGRESFSTADVQLGRLGDFEVREGVFHVTVAPMAPVYQKCLQNVQQGYDAYLLVLDGALSGAKWEADKVAPGRITVLSIESFISQNIGELGTFDKTEMARESTKLLRIYNTRVLAAETDPAFLIDIPPNLERLATNGTTTNGQAPTDDEEDEFIDPFDDAFGGL